ncbi:NAD(P)H-dependent glycerol-3-phosphate dehydrogenase [Trichlorobacter ammonificans]|uniref:Glycerol-3-phosphate dehydrogenase [NAD(P)+] n=1 Tax=Trichlorobacter ammonificans TaxID=2916410 RepID=A0ABM9D3U0_9BACT|nr:NAD(P)H-dependent glycerol-3-phosphate dehydrogenase [Trichlorobacter ammonificans]CAH2029924.1 Glycerol-3-phosphate dehydrogenase [NAD(P)+] [Trichlorobacter ammonificans]
MKVTVIGAGNWGTTLAKLFAESSDVVLGTHSAEHADEITTLRENRRYLPGIPLPERLTARPLAACGFDADDVVVLAVPSRALPELLQELRHRVNGTPLVCATKGFQHATFKTMGQLVRETIPESPLIVLSGPNIARELAGGLPSKAVLASHNLTALTRVARILRNDTLVFELSRDLDGVELCAALKGVIAVGVGIADGLQLGDNMTALLMTYGLREFVEIAEFLEIRHKTIYGIAGLGDLITTCISPNSRNRRFGRLLGEGVATDEALARVGMVVEGVQMARTIVEMGDLNITIPLFTTIARAIFEDNRSLRDEFTACLMHYRG